MENKCIEITSRTLLGFLSEDTWRVAKSDGQLPCTIIIDVALKTKIKNLQTELKMKSR